MLVAIVATGEAAARPDPTIQVRADDAEMEAAKRAGRSSLPKFFAALARPAADERDFALKFDLTPKGTTEFIWAQDISVSRGRIIGRLGNVPMAKGYALGSPVVIDPAHVVDWGYFKGGRMQGHFTTRVLLKRMPPKEAAQMRAALGW
jgi:uncharacterized protein YegJ (DUF2314 family)